MAQNPQHHSRSRELFMRAMDLSLDERAALLSKACEHDPELRGDVESLLAFHDEVSVIRDGPPGASELGSVTVDSRAELLATDPRLMLPLERLMRGGGGWRSDEVIEAWKASPDRDELLALVNAFLDIDGGDDGHNAPDPIIPVDVINDAVAQADAEGIPPGSGPALHLEIGRNTPC